MNRLRLAAAASFIALSCCAQQTRLPAQSGSTLQPLAEAPAAASGSKSTVDSLNLLMRWLHGNFDNNSFVVQQIAAAQRSATGLPEYPVEHVHIQITPITSIQSGQHWLIAREALATSSDRPRGVRLYQLSADASVIKMRGFMVLDPAKLAQLTTNPASAAQLSLTDLRADPAECVIQWRYRALTQQFTSTTTPTRCNSLVTLRAGSTLSDSRIEFDVAALPQARNRFDKARIFRVWGQISRALKSSIPTGKFSVLSGITLHDQGARVTLPMDDRGTPSGFALKLEQRRDDREGTLHLSLVNEQTGALEGEAWGDADANTVGLNLNWIRISVSAEQATAD